MQLKAKDIGGAIVRRPFSHGGRRVLAGARLSAAEVLAMPPNNRQALQSANYLDVFPKTTEAVGERHIVNRGFGKFDVVSGVKLNDEPITKEQAEALAAGH